MISTRETRSLKLLPTSSLLDPRRRGNVSKRVSEIITCFIPHIFLLFPPHAGLIFILPNCCTEMS